MFGWLKNWFTGANTSTTTLVPKGNMPGTTPKFTMNIPDVEIPMDPNPNHPDNKSSIGVMGRFLKMFMGRFKTDLQAEFDANATRINSDEDEMDLEKSKSLLPTVGRALRNSMPTFVGGLISMISTLIHALLGLFKVSESTKETVTGAIKSLGKGLFSGDPTQGLQNIATTAAPMLLKGLTDMLGVKMSPETMKAATSFPKSATFTPKANAEGNTKVETEDDDFDYEAEVNKGYGVTPEKNNSWFPINF